MAALVPFNPNVFFQRVAAERQDAQGMQNSIAGLADAYKESKRAPDLTKLAQSGALKAASGNLDAITPEERTAIGALDLMSNEKYYVDEGGALIKQPSQFSKLMGAISGGQSPAPASPKVFGSALQGGYEYQPEIPRKGAFTQVPQIDAAMLEEGVSMNVGRGTPLPAMGAQDGSIPAQMSQQMAAPKGITAPRTGYLKSDVAAATEAAKADVELQQKQAERQAEKQSDMPREQLKVIQAFEKFGDDENYIDTAINQANNYTAGMGSYLEFIRGTGATDLKNTLSKIQADSAFDRLQEMRDASKTGGALGAVSERELTLLQSAAAPLGQEQSPEQLKRNLENYRNVRKRALRNVADAFNADYGFYPESINLDKVQRDTPSQYTKQDYADRYGIEVE